jgi:hypothetical protein
MIQGTQMQADCFDCLSRAPDGPAMGEWPNQGRGLSEVLARLQEGQTDVRVIGDPVFVRRAYVASRAGFDATNLALGAHGLLPVIDRVFGFAEARQVYQPCVTLMDRGTVALGND